MRPKTDPPPRLTICLAGWWARPPHPSQLSITYPSGGRQSHTAHPAPGLLNRPTPAQLTNANTNMTLIRNQREESVTDTALHPLNDVCLTTTTQIVPISDEHPSPSLCTSCTAILCQRGETCHHLHLQCLHPSQRGHRAADQQHELLQFPKLSCGPQPTLLPIMHPSTQIESICSRAGTHVHLL